MLLQTNSYIVPKDKRAEHARLLARFRQSLAKHGCDHFEAYEQVGANWGTNESSGRFVQIMRFRDRKHQQQVQAAELQDPAAQQLIREFCDLINLPYQQQQGFFASGFYSSVLAVAPQRAPAAMEPEPATPFAPPPVENLSNSVVESVAVAEELAEPSLTPAQPPPATSDFVDPEPAVEESAFAEPEPPPAPAEPPSAEDLRDAPEIEPPAPEPAPLQAEVEPPASEPEAPPELVETELPLVEPEPEPVAEAPVAMEVPAPLFAPNEDLLDIEPPALEEDLTPADVAPPTFDSEPEMIEPEPPPPPDPTLELGDSDQQEAPARESDDLEPPPLDLMDEGEDFREELGLEAQSPDANGQSLRLDSEDEQDLKLR